MGAFISHDFSNEPRGSSKEDPSKTFTSPREAVEALLKSKGAPVWTVKDVAKSWEEEDKLLLSTRRRRYKCGSKFVTTSDIKSWDCQVQKAISDAVSGITTDLREACWESRRRQLRTERRNTKLAQFKKLMQAFVPPTDFTLTKATTVERLAKLPDREIVNRLAANHWNAQRVVDEYANAWNGEQVAAEITALAANVLSSAWPDYESTTTSGSTTTTGETAADGLNQGSGAAGGASKNRRGSQAATNKASQGQGGLSPAAAEAHAKRRRASDLKLIHTICRAAGYKLPVAKLYLNRAVELMNEANNGARPLFQIGLHDAVYFLSQVHFEPAEALKRCRAENNAATPAANKLSLSLHGVREYKLDMALLRSLLRKYANDWDNAIMGYSAAKHHRDRAVRRVRIKLGTNYINISDAEIVKILEARNWDAEAAIADITGESEDPKKRGQGCKAESKTCEDSTDTKHARAMKTRSTIAAAIAAATANATSGIYETKCTTATEGLTINLNEIDTSCDIMSMLTGDMDVLTEAEIDEEILNTEGDAEVVFSGTGDVIPQEEDYDRKARLEDIRIARDLRQRDTPLVTPDAQVEPNTEINKLISHWEGDASLLEMDALVIPSSPTLVQPLVPKGTYVRPIGISSGTTIKASQTQRIYDAAGVRLLSEAAALDRPLEPGNIHITRGYNLPAKHIIHVVPPPRENRETLEHGITAALDAAREKKLKTIVICPIVTAGTSEYPFYAATHATIYAVRRWLDITPNRRSIDRIILCTFHPFETKAYRRILLYYFPGCGQRTYTLLQRFQVMFNHCDPRRDNAFQSELNRMTEEQCELRPPLEVYGQEPWVMKSILALGGGSGVSQNN